MTSQPSRSSTFRCFPLVVVFLYVAVVVAPTAHGAFQGKNGRIAFMKQDRALDSTIWDVRPGAQRARRLTAKPRRCRRFEVWSDEAPDYSPSGRWIVYRHADDCGRGSRSEIRLMRSDGSGSRRLLGFPVGAHTAAPAFSADASEVAFDDLQSGTPTISFIDAGSGRPTRPPLPMSLAFGREPEWSSSGLLALSGYLGQEDDSSGQIIVGDPSAHRFRRITFAGGPRHAIFWGDESPDWAPNGDRIVFRRWAKLCLPDASSADPRARAADPPCESETRDLSYIYVIGAAGQGRARRVAPGDGPPVFSPDGRKIAFERREFIYVIDARRGRARKIARGSQPDWQPVRRAPVGR